MYICTKKPAVIQSISPIWFGTLISSHIYKQTNVSLPFCYCGSSSAHRRNQNVPQKLDRRFVGLRRIDRTVKSVG